MTTSYEQYFAIRSNRLALQRQADELEQQEKDILYELTKELDFSNIGYSRQFNGFVFKANRKDLVTPIDWGLILPYIKETGEVDLLQKRLTDSAVKARWDAGLTIPGIEKSYKWAVTVTKGS